MTAPIILSIETSTHICSVTLTEGKNKLFDIKNDEGMNHAAMLSPFIDEALAVLKNINKKLDAVAVSGGPGSYTGLRIGVSTAKGICYALEIPLIAVDTLEIMAIPVINSNYVENALYCPMIDARRMEVYSAFYRIDRTIFRDVQADIIDSESYQEILENHTVFFFGTGSEKCRTVINHPNACFIENINPLAENMLLPSLQKYEENKFEDTAYFEPFYLKEFQATIPKNKL